MPLLDAFGREIPVHPRRGRPRRPKNKPSPRRVPVKAADTLRSNQSVEVVLRAAHTINGERYGPGRVVVARKIADALREQDGRATQADSNFNSARAFVIGPGSKRGTLGVREVSPDYFDAPELSVVPFGVVDRRSGMFTAN